MPAATPMAVAAMMLQRGRSEFGAEIPASQITTQNPKAASTGPLRIRSGNQAVPTRRDPSFMSFNGAAPNSERKCRDYEGRIERWKVASTGPLRIRSGNN